MSEQQPAPEEAAQVAHQTAEQTAHRQIVRRRKQRAKATWICLGILVAMTLGAYLVPDLAWLPHKLFALFYAGLATLALVFAFFEFGGKIKPLEVPRIGKVPPVAPAGVGVFLFVFLWWLTPLAPIRVATATIEQISAWLGEEIVALTLVLPDEQFPLLQTPILPPTVKGAASKILDDAPVHHLAMRSLAAHQFEAAQTKLRSAALAGLISDQEFNVLAGQTALFAARYDDAVRHFNLARAASKDGPWIAAQAAAALAHSGKLAEAEQIAVELLEGSDNKVPLPLRLNLVTSVLVAQGRYEAARQIAEDDDYAKQSLPDDSPSEPVLNNNRAVRYCVRGKFESAKLQLDAARDGWRQIDPQAHLATALHNQGMRQIAIGNYGRAEELLNRALNLKRNSLHADHPAIGVSFNGVAAMRLVQGHYHVGSKQPEDNAETMIDEAGALYSRNRFAPTSPFRLATRFQQLRRQSAARPEPRGVGLYRRLLQDVDQTLSPERRHPLAAILLRQIAREEIRAGHPTQAHQDATRAWEIDTKGGALPEEHAAGGEDQTALAEVEIAQYLSSGAVAKRDSALKRLAGAEEKLKKALGEKHLIIADTFAAKASSYTGSQARLTGLGLYRKAIVLVENAFGAGGKTHPLKARYLHQIGLILSKQEATQADAERSFRGALAIRKLRQPQHPDTAATLVALAKLLRATDRADEAASLEQQAAEILAVDQPDQP
jgi:tetratricopeptide (TPR) repeat protein